MSPTFAELPLRSQTIEALHAHGFLAPFAIQEMVLPIALADGDVLVRRVHLRIAEHALARDAAVHLHLAVGLRVGPDGVVPNVLIHVPVHASGIAAHHAFGVLLADHVGRNKQTFQAVNDGCGSEGFHHARTATVAGS